MRIAKAFLGVALVAGIGTAYAADADKLFQSSCAMCHGATAQGTPGLAPPLKSGQWSKFAGARNYVPGVLLAGMNGSIALESGPFMGVMPTQNRLSDDEIAALANYLYATVNGNAEWKPLTAAEVATLRQNTPTVSSLRTMRKQALGQ